MEITEFRPKGPITRSKYLPFDTEITVVPIGDLHAGSEGFKPTMLRQVIEQTMGDNTYYIGMGDYIDLEPGHDRNAMRSAGVWDGTMTMFDSFVADVVEELLDVLAPAKGSFMGLLEGNHYHTFLSGETSDQRLARGLGAPFWGTCNAHVMRFRYQSERGTSAKCTFWAHHGYGGGVTPAASLNKLHRAMEFFLADVYLLGHNHKMTADRAVRLSISDVSGKLVHTNCVLCATGAFLASYEQGSQVAGRPKGRYEEAKMYLPAPIGAPIITVCARRFGKNRDTVIDLKVTT